ncbi:MAG: helix-turn-helix transcriptional regulator [Clostridia bacterium]|nr:helix-turn-helix transcriptional regulator [Clostridia bacterium]
MAKTHLNRALIILARNALANTEHTPAKYITVRRIERAVGLLKTTDKSVLEIATECGFNNTANFNKLFKNHTGTVPKAIRAAR